MTIIYTNKVQCKVFDRFFKGSTHCYSYNNNNNRCEVDNNRLLIKQYVNANSLHTMTQVHGNGVVRITGSESEYQEQVGDAIITTIPKIMIAIKTADCVPVLISDISGEIVSAIHCSSKCTRQGLIDKTVAAIRLITSKRLIASLGPSIKQESYEVGLDFYENIINESKMNSIFFILLDNNKYLFDLPSYVVFKLQSLGVQIDYVSPHDTCKMSYRYPSHRYSFQRGERYHGKILSTIMIKA